MKQAQITPQKNAALSRYLGESYTVVRGCLALLVAAIYGLPLTALLLAILAPDFTPQIADRDSVNYKTTR